MDDDDVEEITDMKKCEVLRKLALPENSCREN